MPAPKKPTKLRILEGNRGKRPLLPEPEPAPGIPRMPAGMPKTAQTLWRVLTAELDRLNLITIVDGTSMEAACRAVGQARAADKAIEAIQARIGASKAEEHDFYRLTVLNAVSRKAWQQWKSFGTEFGLTPASRARLAGADFASHDPRNGSPMDAIERALCGDGPRTSTRPCG